MRLFGYESDPRVLDEQIAFDEVAQPLFHAGNEIGCLVLHGIGGTPANIRLVADALIEQGYTVYAPTLPGHGKTVRALNASTGAQWLRAAFAGYDRLVAVGCTKIVPIGLSLGGILSAHVASRRPCAALVLISAPIRMKPYLRFSRFISPLIPFIRYRVKDEERTRMLAPYSQMYPGFSTAKLHDLQHLIIHLRFRLQYITCPTLALWAKYDNKVDKSSSMLLRRNLKNALLTERRLENSPHGSTYGAERGLAARIVADYVGETLRSAALSSKPDAALLPK